jgi:glucosyl-dolichyl phosphate glucuronosyltransferase
MENNVSIIICTYNRANYLKANIESIIKYGYDFRSKFEILVVDNNSSDDTCSIVTNLKFGDFNVRYIKEVNQGLSYARNKGVKNALHNWVYFVDDDMLFVKETLPELFKSIDKGYLMFGGLFSPHFLGNKPRWISNEFRKKKTANTEFDVLPKSEFITGCNMVIHKFLFNIVGEFNVNLGMRGNEIGYYEEVEFQRRAESKGYKLGMNPSLFLYEVIRPDKLTIRWAIHEKYALGRDWGVQNSNYRVSVLRCLFNGTKGIFSALKKLLITKRYYIENALIDSMQSFVFDLGVFHVNKKIKL